MMNIEINSISIPSSSMTITLKGDGNNVVISTERTIKHGWVGDLKETKENQKMLLSQTEATQLMQMLQKYFN